MLHVYFIFKFDVILSLDYLDCYISHLNMCQVRMDEGNPFYPFLNR